MGESGVTAGIKGVTEDLKGKAKKVVGSLTGNESLEREGEAQQDAAANEREVAEHEAKADVARAKAEADKAREKAEQNN